MYPAVLLWGLVVLRPLRFYGTFTFLNQGWTTRTKGAEVSLAQPAAGTRAAAPVLEGSVA
jgi:hypothetical protein